MPVPTRTRRVRVFLLDDHTVLRAGLRALLSLDDRIEVVGEAGCVREGLAQIVRTRPDVAVVDVHLAGGSGLETFVEARRLNPGMRGLVLTGRDDESALRAAIDAGASGYLLKDVDHDDLITAMVDIADGRDLIDPVVVRQLTRDDVDPDPAHDPDRRLAASLTTQERRILALLATGASNREIAETLFLVEKTVRNHVTRILAKLGVQRRTQAALIATRLQLSERA